MDKSSSITDSPLVSTIPKKRSPTKSRKTKSIEKNKEDEKIVIKSTKIKWKKELIEVVNIISFKKYNLMNTHDNGTSNTIEEGKISCKCGIF